MVSYQPPDSVLIAVGATFRSEPLVAAGRRIAPLAAKDLSDLAQFGIEEAQLDKVKVHLKSLERALKDPRVKKNDTPLQMARLAETMAHARGWMKTLRMVGAINLGLDAPALAQVASREPELVEGYARDLMAEFELRVRAGLAARPRLEDAGLTPRFLKRGRELARQLKTAIGSKDIDGKDLHLTIRRLYLRKANLYVLLKRLTRAGHVAYMARPDHAARYHLDEIEPTIIEDPKGTTRASAASAGPTDPLIHRPRR